MSAMPPVDNYITIYIYFIEKPWQALDITMVSRPNVEINCNDIFMRHFWSTWNAKVIAQSQCNHSATTGRNGGLLGADAEKKIVFHGH